MQQIPTLETDRLILVEITKEYIDALFEMYSDKEIAFFFCIEPHANANETLRKIESIESDFRNGKAIEWAIVLKDLNTMVGTVGFNTYKKGFKGNIGYGIHRKFWRRGFACEAIREIVRYGFEELNLHRIEADVDPRNHASVALMHKLGFLKEGHIRDNEYFLGEFCSTIVFGKLVTDSLAIP